MTDVYVGWKEMAMIALYSIPQMIWSNPQIKMRSNPDKQSNPQTKMRSNPDKPLWEHVLNVCGN